MSRSSSRLNPQKGSDPPTLPPSASSLSTLPRPTSTIMQAPQTPSSNGPSYTTPSSSTSSSNSSFSHSSHYTSSTSPSTSTSTPSNPHLTPNHSSSSGSGIRSLLARANAARSLAPAISTGTSSSNSLASSNILSRLASRPRLAPIPSTSASIPTPITPITPSTSSTSFIRSDSSPQSPTRPSIGLYSSTPRSPSPMREIKIEDEDEDAFAEAGPMAEDPYGGLDPLGDLIPKEEWEGMLDGQHTLLRALVRYDETHDHSGGYLLRDRNVTFGDKNTPFITFLIRDSTEQVKLPLYDALPQPPPRSSWRKEWSGKQVDVEVKLNDKKQVTKQVTSIPNCPVVVWSTPYGRKQRLLLQTVSSSSNGGSIEPSVHEKTATTVRELATGRPFRIMNDGRTTSSPHFNVSEEVRATLADRSLIVIHFVEGTVKYESKDGLVDYPSGTAAVRLITEVMEDHKENTSLMLSNTFAQNGVKPVESETRNSLAQRALERLCQGYFYPVKSNKYGTWIKILNGVIMSCEAHTFTKGSQIFIILKGGQVHYARNSDELYLLKDDEQALERRLKESESFLVPVSSKYSQSILDEIFDKPYHLYINESLYPQVFGPNLPQLLEDSKIRKAAAKKELEAAKEGLSRPRRASSSRSYSRTQDVEDESQDESVSQPPKKRGRPSSKKLTSQVATASTSSSSKRKGRK